MAAYNADVLHVSCAIKPYYILDIGICFIYTKKGVLYLICRNEAVLDYDMLFLVDTTDMVISPMDILPIINTYIIPSDSNLIVQMATKTYDFSNTMATLCVTISKASLMAPLH